MAARPNVPTPCNYIDHYPLHYMFPEMLRYKFLKVVIAPDSTYENKREYPEDDNVDIDVEECSDVESSRPTDIKSRELSPPVSDSGSEPADLDQEPADIAPVPSPVLKKPKILCNCEELLSVECNLETKELWDKFHDLGTEMIITKTGR